MTNNFNNEVTINGAVTVSGNLNIGCTTEKKEVKFIINQVCSKKKLKRIIRKEIKLELQQQQLTAENIAKEKLLVFFEKVLPKLEKYEMFDAFGDPSIQMFFRATQKTAICSNRVCDYSILSELLVHRINNKSDIFKNASISKAVEIIDKITDDALLAITLMYLNKFYPVNGNIENGLRALDTFLKDIISDSDLPSGVKWIENAEILGIIRVERFGKNKKYEESLFENISGYISKGIEKNSDLYIKTIEKMSLNNIPLDLLVEHSLNPNYVRLNVVNEKSIDDIQIDENQTKILKEIYNSYIFEDNSIVKENLLKRIDKYTYLNKYMEWLNTGVPYRIILNSVGRVIAHANTKRIREDIPDMVK